MGGKIDMALDDIIKTTKKPTTRRGGRGNFRGGSNQRGRGFKARGGSSNNSYNNNNNNYNTGKEKAFGGYNKKNTNSGTVSYRGRGNTRGGRGRGGARNTGVNRSNYNSFTNKNNVKRLSGGRNSFGRGMTTRGGNSRYNNNNNNNNNKVNTFRRGTNNFLKRSLRSTLQTRNSSRPTSQRGAQSMLQDQNNQVRQLQMLAQNQQLLQRQLQQLQTIQSRQSELLLSSSSNRSMASSSSIDRYNDGLDRDVLLF